MTMLFEILTFYILRLSPCHLISFLFLFFQLPKSFEKPYLLFVMAVVFLVIPLFCHIWAASYSCVLSRLLFFCENWVKTDRLISSSCCSRSSCLTCWRFAARNNRITDCKNTITFSPAYCVLWSFKWPLWGRIFCICLHPSGRKLSSYPLSSESFLTLFYKEGAEGSLQL